MSILKFLNPFQENITEEPNISSPVNVPLTSTVTNVGITSNSLGIDPKIQLHFDELMNKANLPGPDYYEFRKAVKESNSIIPENILYQTIYNTFKSLGINKNLLLSSIDEYIKIIGNDKNDFDKTISELEKNEIANKQKQIESNKAKIEQLQKSINELNQSNIQIQNEINESSIKITYKAQSYNTSNSSIIQELNNDKQKINQYINE